MQDMFRVVWRVAAIMVTMAAGCAPDPLMDGRYWRQPGERRAGVRGMSPSVGVHGDTAQSGIGPGFGVSGAFDESGGARVGRAGLTAQSGYWIGVSTVVGSAGGTARSGVCTDTLAWPGVTGSSAQSGSFGESSMSAGTLP